MSLEMRCTSSTSLHLTQTSSHKSRPVSFAAFAAALSLSVLALLPKEVRVRREQLLHPREIEERGGAVGVVLRGADAGDMQPVELAGRQCAAVGVGLLLAGEVRIVKRQPHVGGKRIDQRVAVRVHRVGPSHWPGWRTSAQRRLSA